MQNFQLLLIDDDSKTLNLIQNMLVGFDHPRYQVEWATTYTEGLNKLKENQHDACLLDYRLGHQNGISLLQDALKEGCDVPIILLTAYGNHELDLEVMELGSMDYLDKRRLTPAILERSVRYAYTRKNLEQELRKLYKEKEYLERLKSDMIRIASHDIQNPVTSILLNLHILRTQRDTNLPPNVIERIDIIEQKTNQIKNLVGSLLSLEWIESLHQHGLSTIDLVPIIKKVASETADQFAEKKQIFSIDIPDESISIQGEATQLKEAISNILLNAHRYTPEQGHIQLRVEVIKNEAIVTCKDDGYGVLEADHKRIFHPFFRSQHTAQLEGGSGLGLHW